MKVVQIIETMLALLVSVAVLTLIWTVPVVENEPDLCVRCMGWEGQRLAITLGIAVAWAMMAVILLVTPERWHDGYDGCEACSWRT